MQRMIDEHDLCEKLVAGGLASYEQQFTKSVFVRDSIAFYQDVVDAADG